MRGGGQRRVVHYAAASVEGGLTRHLELLACRTDARGWSSQAWLSPDPSLDLLAARLGAGEIPVRRLTVRGKGDLAGILSMARALRALRPSILHVHLASPVESLPVLLAVPAAGARIVTTEHAPTHHPLERTWSAAAKRRGAKRAARIITLNEGDAAYLQDHFGIRSEKIRVIPNGVGPDPLLPERAAARRDLGIPEEAVAVACVGEIVERKGIRELLQAVEILAGKCAGRAPVFLLAGDGPLLPELRDRKDLHRHLLLPGSVRPPDPVLAACDIFALPSLGEAMPIALLEGMAAGLPVVASRVGGIPEIVREGVEGRLVEPGSAAELASAIRDLAEDGAARRRMGEASRARVRDRYDAGRMADRTCALYDEILEGSP